MLKPLFRPTGQLDPPSPPYWCTEERYPAIDYSFYKSVFTFDVNLDFGMESIQQVRSDCNQTHLALKHYCGITSRLRCQKTVNWVNYVNKEQRCDESFRDEGCESTLRDQLSQLAVSRLLMSLLPAAAL